MGFFQWSADDQKFIGFAAFLAILGIPAGLLLPWLSLLGLTIVIGVFWFFALIIFVGERFPGPWHTGIVIGVPIMIGLWWGTFFIAIGLRP